MLRSSSTGQIPHRCQERVVQHGHTHQCIYQKCAFGLTSARCECSECSVFTGCAWRKGLQEGISDPFATVNNLVRFVCPRACNPLHCPMEGTVPGSTMALATSTFPGNASTRLGRWHRPGMVPGGGTGKCILSGGREGCGLSCAFGAREQPPVTLHQRIYQLSDGEQHLSSVPASVWKEQIPSCLSSMRSSVPAPCPVLQTPSPQEDAHSSGPPASRGVSVSRLQWQQGVCEDLPCSASLAGECHNSKQTLPVAAGNKVDPEIPELWEVGFNVINCNRRRGQIIGAKVSL